MSSGWYLSNFHAWLATWSFVLVPTTAETSFHRPHPWRAHPSSKSLCSLSVHGPTPSTEPTARPFFFFVPDADAAGADDRALLPALAILPFFLLDDDLSASASASSLGWTLLSLDAMCAITESRSTSRPPLSLDSRSLASRYSCFVSKLSTVCLSKPLARTALSWARAASARRTYDPIRDLERRASYLPPRERDTP